MTKAELLAALSPYTDETEIVCPDLEPIVEVEYVEPRFETVGGKAVCVMPALLILCDCAADDVEGEA